VTDDGIASAGWESLSATWQARSETPGLDPAAMRARVDAVTRHMRWWVAAELCLTAVALAVSAWIVRSDSSPGGLFLAADIWIVTAIVWTFAIVSRRGTWRPLSETTDAYLTLARERVVRRLGNVRFTLIILVAQSAAVLATGSPGNGVGRRGVALAGLVAWLGWAAWEQRRATRELSRLDVLRAELTEASSAG